jgi:YegS/Rv2252/BmrU family lipid kinase
MGDEVLRCVLIVNPKAGTRNPLETVFPSVRAAFCDRKVDFTWYETKYPGHATEIAEREAARGDTVAIYGFGGDGTLSEIASGLIGKENAAVGIFPCGSGNDYIKTFGSMEDFLSPEKQLHAQPGVVDMIRSGDQYAMNLCTVGMDAKIPLEVEKLKRFRFLSGPAAYNLGLIRTILGRIGDEMLITIDGSRRYEDCFLMAVAACGRYYGGGYHAAPEAVPDDGLLDFILIRKPAFHRLPKLISLYKAGKHLKSKEFDGILTFHRGKRMEIMTAQPVAQNLDGECSMVERTSFEVVPSAVRFLIPQG